MYQGVTTDRFVQPDIVATHFYLHDGDRVADFGAGTGFFLPVLSQAVGAEGRVYAIEVQKNLVEALGGVIREQKLTNTSALWCDVEALGGVKLADGTLDAVFLINTLFQLEDKKAALAEIARVLRKKGKLVVIDWSESFGGTGPHGDAIVSLGMARELAESAGFAHERTFPAGAHHYGVVFRKPR